MSTIRYISEKRRPLRVAIVHYRDEAVMGGSLRVGETIANHLDPEKVQAHLVFVYGDPGPVAERARVPCHFVRAKGPEDLPAWRKARSIIHGIAPDLIHYQDAIIWFPMALIGTPYKTLLHVHGRYLPEYVTWKNKVLVRAFMRKVDSHVCISHGARDSLLKFGLASPENAFVVYNSIEIDRFNVVKVKRDARLRLRLPEEALLLGMVCRITWAKGCPDLLSLLERLPSRWHGVFCGDGPQLPELIRQCEKRGLARRVHFLYSQDDVAPVYQSLDAYVFLSRYEPFGLVIAEAMAAGVPIFGLGGDGEYREPQYPLVTSNNSIFVGRHDAANYEVAEAPDVIDELAARIADFGENPQRHESMTKRAREWVRSRFDASVQAEAITRVYERLCASDTTGPPC